MVPESGLILADYDGTLCPGDSHARLLRHILLARRWPLLLLLALSPLLLLLCVPCRTLTVRLVWWCATFGATAWQWRRWVVALAHRAPPLYGEAASLLAQVQAHAHARLWVVSASPQALVRRSLSCQCEGSIRISEMHVYATRMARRFGAIVPRHYAYGAAKLTRLPPLSAPVTLALSDSVSDLPLLALASRAWLINPKQWPLAKAPRRLEPRVWR